MDEQIINPAVTFESLGLCPELVAACDRLGYKHPTPI